MSSQFSPDRYIKVWWSGKTNAGSAVAADLAVGDWIMSKTDPTGGDNLVYTEPEGDRVLRMVQPDTSNDLHCFARKFVVARVPDDVNTIVSGSQRKGGFVWVFNPNHPDNQVVDAKVTGTMNTVGVALTVGNESFAAAALTIDASALIGSRVATLLEANASGTNLRRVALHPQ